MTNADAGAIASWGDHHNVPGKFFTRDGEDAHFPNAKDHFPDKQTNLVSVPLSMGAYNCLQQERLSCLLGIQQITNWAFPLLQGAIVTGRCRRCSAAGERFDVSSLIPGSGPRGVNNDQPELAEFGDDPDNPRDPDRGSRTQAPMIQIARRRTMATQRNAGLPFIPSGLANEILLDVFVREIIRARGDRLQQASLRRLCG